MRWYAQNDCQTVVPPQLRVSDTASKCLWTTSCMSEEISYEKALRDKLLQDILLVGENLMKRICIDMICHLCGDSNEKN